MIDTGGIILAGGKSERMGEDKSFILFSGRPLIEIVIEKLLPIFQKLIIITNKPELYQYGMKTYSDIFKGCGPLGGIYTALVYSEALYNFICACDMPFINEALIKYMVEEVKGYDVAIPGYSGKFEPLCAVYSKNCIEPIKKMLLEKNLRIRDFFKDVRVRLVSEEEVGKFDSEGFSFMNINTPEDYRRIYGRI